MQSAAVLLSPLLAIAPLTLALSAPVTPVAQRKDSYSGQRLHRTILFALATSGARMFIHDRSLFSFYYFPVYCIIWTDFIAH